MSTPETLEPQPDTEPTLLVPTFSSDGTSGEYKPEPIEDSVPRLRGTGLAGIPAAPTMTRYEHVMAVRAGELGSVHSWELVTAVDGPGTRMTVFLAGCLLRCLYCHNPDTLAMKDGHPTRLKDMVERILRYKAIFQTTGGGLTISGGEPLMQPMFTRNLLREVKAAGINTCIDSSGFLGRNMPTEEFGNLDLVLLDVKSGDPETYKRVTGLPLQPTLDFGDRLADNGVKMWIRFVLVPGLTDDPDNIARAADIAAGWKTVERVEVLPFHKMGEDKWRELGMDYKLQDTPTPTREQAEAAREIFRERGLQVF